MKWGAWILGELNTFFKKKLALLVSFKLETKKLMVASKNATVFILRTKYDGHSKKKNNYEAAINLGWKRSTGTQGQYVVLHTL